MRYPDRVTMCVSSQAGCGMNCPFCATGQAGLTRNLSTAEIVEQVVAAAGRCARRVPAARPGDNVVFMGMGEPLANYNAAAARRAPAHRPAARRARHRPARDVTVSTVGLVPAIDQLAGEGLPVTLAVSLHAPDDELRDTLVPVNTRWKVARGARRGLALRRRDRSPGLHRVRADPRHQRPGVAGRPARRGCCRASWCTST